MSGIDEGGVTSGQLNEGTAVTVLQKMGLDLGKVRTEVEKLEFLPWRKATRSSSLEKEELGINDTI